MSARNLAKLLAALTLISLLLHARLVFVAFGYPAGGTLPLALGAGTLLYFVLGAASIVGLWSARPWGFYAFYPHVILGTVVFGVSFLPFLPGLLPVEARLWFILGVNLAALVVAGLVQWKIARDRS